jgi:hypothetical protein
VPTVQVYLDEEEYGDLMLLAMRRQVKVRELIREAVKEYVRLLKQAKPVEAGAKP